MAKERAIRYDGFEAFVDTLRFQAPEFYIKHGYALGPIFR